MCVGEDRCFINSTDQMIFHRKKAHTEKTFRRDISRKHVLQINAIFDFWKSY